MIIKYRFFIVLLVLLFLSTACTPPVKNRIFWPIPPDRPRLEFIDVFHSKNDFDKTPMEIFWEQVLGAVPAPGFIMPMDAASASDGRVFIADALLQNVRVFDFNLRQANLLTGRTRMGRPMGLDFVPPNLLYVADASQRRVMVFDVDTGKMVQSIGKRGEMLNPVKVLVHKGLGRIYISDSGIHKVHVYDLEGERLFDFGGKGSSRGAMNSPQGLAFDDQDRLYVAEQFNARVQIFDADGNYINMFGQRGDREWQMEMPRDIDIDADGHIYVVDVKKASVMIYNLEGEYHSSLGLNTKSVSPFGFINPTGIYIDNNQRIYITDGLAKRFTVWQYLTPEYLEKNPLPLDLYPSQ